VNSDRYINDTLNPFFNQLTAEERQHVYFQQDDATAHTANATMFAIREVFEDWIIDLFTRCEACLQAEVVTFNTCYKAR
jgi:succinylglutamate desuccinylase